MGHEMSRRRLHRQTAERSRAPNSSVAAQSQAKLQNIRAICTQSRRHGLVMFLRLCSLIKAPVAEVSDRRRPVVHPNCADVIKAHGVQFQKLPESAPQPFNLKTSSSEMQVLYNELT